MPIFVAFLLNLWIMIQTVTILYSSGTYLGKDRLIIPVNLYYFSIAILSFSLFGTVEIIRTIIRGNTYKKYYNDITNLILFLFVLLLTHSVMMRYYIEKASSVLILFSFSIVVCGLSLILFCILKYVSSPKFEITENERLYSIRKYMEKLRTREDNIDKVKTNLKEIEGLKRESDDNYKQLQEYRTRASYIRSQLDEKSMSEDEYKKSMDKISGMKDLWSSSKTEADTKLFQKFEETILLLLNSGNNFSEQIPLLFTELKDIYLKNKINDSTIYGRMKIYLNDYFLEMPGVNPELLEQLDKLLIGIYKENPELRKVV